MFLLIAPFFIVLFVAKAGDTLIVGVQDDFHLNSHVFLMNTSQTIVDQNFLMLQSLRYMYAKNIPISETDVYLLEKNNRDFIFNTLDLEKNKKYSRSGQYMGKLRDIEVFAKRNLVKELNIIGDDYKLRENHINEYILLGEVLSDSGTEYFTYFSNTEKLLKAEIKELRNQKKQLFDSYKQFIKNKNLIKSEETGKKINTLSKNLVPKELAEIRYTIFLKDIQKNNIIVKKNMNAILENKDALIKNVTIKLKSGEYIKIIEK
ncbi:TPA: hypothetical protein EYP45_00140 [Candidatus Peregrinibacteria bacterium]|nr:hypothetical protein [Candidatus Peregrinibacteria bacterium]HIQ57326.1 hypothetical protein [Candidatus Gracilibacteria bacterium]